MALFLLYVLNCNVVLSFLCGAWFERGGGATRWRRWYVRKKNGDRGRRGAAAAAAAVVVLVAAAECRGTFLETVNKYFAKPVLLV